MKKIYCDICEAKVVEGEGFRYEIEVPVEGPVKSQVKLVIEGEVELCSACMKELGGKLVGRI